MRGVPLCLGFGLAGTALLAALGLFSVAVLPSYLAAWLFVSACPLGALPLVLGHDLLRRAETPTIRALRAMLPLMLLAAVMAVPVALQRPALYPTMATTGGFAGAWMAPSALALRGGIAAVVWLGLAALSWRPPRRAGLRGGLAGAGLVLHLVLGTLLVTDWVAAIDPALASSSLGLTVLVAQAGVALSIAVLVSHPVGLLSAKRSDGDVSAGLLLLWLSGAWLFLHFTQYLVVWSANLPGEVPWYIRRDAGLGGLAEAAAALVFLVALVVLLRPGGRLAVTAVAAAILLVHLMEMFWLVVPAARGSFGLGLADLAAACGLTGLAGAALLALQPTKALR